MGRGSSGRISQEPANNFADLGEEILAIDGGIKRKFISMRAGKLRNNQTV